MSDVWFVVAGFTGILGGLALYTSTLALRLRAARRAAGEPGSASPETAEPPSSPRE